MKRACLVAMLLLVFACEKNAVPSATDAKDTTKDIDATITFSGLITHVLGPYQRAVVVYSTTHPHEVTIHATAFQKEAEDMIKLLPGGNCTGDSCSFKLQYMSLQLLDAKKEPLGGDLTFKDGSFERLVTQLDDIDPVAFKADNLAPAVTRAPEENSTISWGFVDLHGGDASTTALPCHGKILDTATEFSEFSGGTSVHYKKLTGGGFLRVAVAGQKEPHDIPLTGPEIEIEVDNNLNSKDSHFHEYDKLTTAAGHKLPTVKLDEQSPACKKVITESGGVPGCHDTRVNGGGGGTT